MDSVKIVSNHLHGLYYDSAFPSEATESKSVFIPKTIFPFHSGPRLPDKLHIEEVPKSKMDYLSKFLQSK